MTDTQTGGVEGLERIKRRKEEGGRRRWRYMQGREKMRKAVEGEVKDERSNGRCVSA